MPRLYRKAIAKRGLTAQKVYQLLVGYDWYATAYGDEYDDDGPHHRKRFDEDAAKNDWARAKVFLKNEYIKLNPGRIPWASWKLDGEKLPDGQTSFGGANTQAIVDQFPHY